MNFAEPHGVTRNDDGFSLIELLLVIVILGILGSVVFVSVQGISERSQTTACDHDAHTLAVAVESYFAQGDSATIPASGQGTDRYEQTLVEADLVRGPSEYWDVAPEGYLLAATPCDHL